MPKLRNLTAGGEIAELTPSFPCVTCPVQANMTTGRGPAEHGVVANGFYWREKRQVEMWTAPNDCIERPQIWDLLSHHGRRAIVGRLVSHAQQGLRGGLRLHARPDPQSRRLGIALVLHAAGGAIRHAPRSAWATFPLMHFWGPMANVEATAWIADSAVLAARQWQPDFFYIYLPHLDYAAQRTGPDSVEPPIRPWPSWTR